MKRILLTGSTGLVGKAALQALLEQNVHILCLGRSAPPHRKKNLEFIQADFANFSPPILEKLHSVDTVIHMAAHLGNNSENDFLLYQNVNIVFTEVLFRYYRNHGVKKIIYVSGLNFLQKPLHPLIDENHPVAPLTPYALSKYWGELILFNYASKRFKPVALRLSSPLPEHYKDLPETVVKKWIQRARNREPIEVFASGKRSQDFVSTHDIAAAITKTVFAPDVEGIFNIASGHSLSMKKLAEIISTHFKQAPIKFVGIDPNENDWWNISIKKAQKEISYAPRYKPEEMITRLLDSADENRHTQ